MTATWAYPWSFLDDQSRVSFSDLTANGIDAVNVASHYHSIRTLEPRRSGRPFQSSPGGCYFEPPTEHFEETPITPQVNEVGGSRDPLGDVVAAATDAAVTVNAWFVCLHNSRLGAANPTYRVQSAYGTPQDHGLCPSHPDVRSYFAGVARSLAAYDVGEIQLESVGFPNAFHGHGAAFGHDKNQAVTDDAAELLLSQCFCRGCRAAAREHAVDFDRTRAVVRGLCDDVLAGPGASVGSLEDLATEHPALADLFDFRADVIERLVRDLADASGDVPLNYYVADGLGHEPDDGWPAGVVLPRLEPHLDRATALCYTGDPATARRRVERLDEAVDLPVDVGVTVDPDAVDSRETWRTVVDAVRDRCEQVHVYNLTLLTDEHLAWLGETFG